MKKILFGMLIIVVLGLTACGKEEQLDVTNMSLSVEEALETFHNTYSNVKLSAIEVTEERSKLVYEIDGFDDTKEYTVQVSEENEVDHKKEEARENDEQYQELVLTDYLTAEDALSRAAQVSETKDLIPTSWSLDTENGTVVYSINFEDAKKEVEVTLDAQTGEELFVELDD